jgi:tetratricopeptide (TPR) repeat protein
MFNKAIDIDPDYARAHCGVADACSQLYTYFDAREFNLRQADNSSRRALELAPGLAEAHVARGMAVSLSKRFDEAEREFETAIKIDPKSYEAAYWYARSLQSAGRFEEAVRMYDRAQSLRPDEYLPTTMQTLALGGLGKMNEREAAAKRATKLIEARLQLDPDDVRAANLGAAVYGSIGNRERALELAARSLAIDPDDPMLLYNVACTYLRFDDMHEDAMQCLERAIDKGFGHKEWIDHDPDLDSLRDHPRFKALSQAI